MKKTIILLACAFLVCLNTFAYDVDVIITKSREQIQCMIISQNGDTITYKSTYQDDQQVYKIAKSDVEKVFIHDKEPAKSTTTNTKPAPQKVVNDGQEVKKAVSQTASAAQSKVKSDLIITKDAKKIDAKIIEVSKNEIKYKELDNLEGPTFVLETKEISSIIYANGKVVLYNDEAKSEKDNLEHAQLNSNTDDGTKIEILLLSGEKIIAHAKELNDDVLYFTVNGEHRTMAASRIEKVTYMQSGQVKQYHSKTIPTESVSESNKSKNPQIPSSVASVDNISLARVEKVNGILVFTDCTPLAQYDVIGEVSVIGSGSQEIQRSGAQYQSVRDELIKTAKSANGMAEGVILTLVTGGTDKAHIIKFRDPSEKCDLANVKRYRGIYVFCDCTPLSSYDYVGTLKGKLTLIPQYTNLRDDLIQKCTKKYKDANGLIIQLVSGGKDTAEAIKL